MQRSNSPKGLLFLIIAAVIWGFAFVAQRLGSESVAPFTFNGVRYLIGALSLIPVIFIFEHRAKDRSRHRATLLSGILAGSLLWAASYLQQLGIMNTDYVGKAGFITGLYMVFVPLIGLAFRRKIGAPTWIAVLFGLAGLFLTCMGGGSLSVTFGDGLILLSSLLYAGQIVVIDLVVDRIYALRFAFVQFMTCSLLNGAGAFFFERGAFSFAGLESALIPILYCGVGSVGIAFTCQILGQRFSEPAFATLVLSTETVFSLIGSMLILGERMSPQAYIGCGLIFAGILVSKVRKRRPRTEKRGHRTLAR